MAARRLPSLNQLRAFEAAARHQSIKDGAEELCVTAAAVGHQIKALEQDLKTQLFHRKTRQVVLTEAGQKLAEAVGQALDSLDSAVAAARSAPLGGPLTLTVAPFFGNRWLLPRLGRWRAQHPDLEIQTFLSFDYVDLRQADFMAALRFGDGEGSGLTSRLIFHDEVGPVCAPQLVEGQALPMTVEQILSLPLACARSWRDDWRAWVEATGQAFQTPGNLVEHESRAFMFDAALSGQAVILADARMTAADEAAGRLVRLHPMAVTRPQGIYLVTATAAHDPRLETLITWLRAEAEA